MKSYAGIGSRETPTNILEKMTLIATILQDHLTLRSGGADGADQAFENGISNGNKEIFLHKKGAFGNNSNLYSVCDKALRLAARFHPVWDRLGDSAKKLMGRNCYQVLGKNLDDPVEFVICYTSDGCESGEYRTINTGGTGQAIHLASYLDIPVINMKNTLWEVKLDELLERLSIPFSIEMLDK